MTQFQIRSLENSGRTTSTWNAEIFDHQPNFGEVAMALLPATLILMAATALLVALL